ncbi:MAG: response regulator [Bryobacteraceae bacterium]
MNQKQPASETNRSRIVTVLFASPLAEDHHSIQAVFNHTKWELHKSNSLASALPVIRRGDIGVVICDADLHPGTWIDMLEGLKPMRVAPTLVVTSRLADERLWAEALNLGAYDVLAKPFEPGELVRSVSSAWLNWSHRQEFSSKGMIARHAAR